MYKTQRQIIRSFAGRAIAVRRVVTNNGGKTAGIDKKILKDPKEYYEAIEELGKTIKSIKTYKSSPLRRVEIPKPGKKEKRKLGIPTIKDRMIQAVYQLALDPVVEAHSDLDSFGFRKERSTQDAIAHFNSYMNKK